MQNQTVNLDQNELDKFEKMVKPDGIIIYDDYGIHTPPTRKDIKIYKIKCLNQKKKKSVKLKVII